MKKINLILIIVVALISFSFSSFAISVSGELDSLGANRKLLKKARAVHSKKRIRIVQKRAVDRNLRLEAHTGLGYLAGGDPYVDSSMLGVNLDFHINPRWSLGVRYSRYNNSLSSEGERVFKDVSKNNPLRDVYDYSISSTMGTITWYPMYGKFNLFNVRVVQFDIYTLAGAGTVELASSGNQPIWTVGGGIGLWLSKHISTRFEIRYQSYQDTLSTNVTRDIDQTIFGLNIGFLL